MLFKVSPLTLKTRPFWSKSVIIPISPHGNGPHGDKSLCINDASLWRRKPRCWGPHRLVSSKQANLTSVQLPFVLFISHENQLQRWLLYPFIETHIYTCRQFDKHKLTTTMWSTLKVFLGFIWWISNRQTERTCKPDREMPPTSVDVVLWSQWSNCETPLWTVRLSTINDEWENVARWARDQWGFVLDA